MGCVSVGVGGQRRKINSLFSHEAHLGLLVERVSEQEKKAHENWVAARQAERKLNDLQVNLKY
jgi:hypothetical protein